MATKTPAPPATQTPEKAKRGFKFPTAFTILFLVLVLVWALTFIIKPGSYAYVSCDGGTPKPIPGTFANTTVSLNFVNRLYDQPTGGYRQGRTANLRRHEQRPARNGGDCHAAGGHRPLQRR